MRKTLMPQWESKFLSSMEMTAWRRIGREVVVVDDDAALEGKGADDAALAVVEVGRGRWAVALEVVDLRQIDGEDQREPGERAGDDGKQQQDRECNLAGDLAAAKQGRWNRLRAQPMGPAKAARFDSIVQEGQPRNQASLAFLSLQLPEPNEDASASRLARLQIGWSARITDKLANHDRYKSRESAAQISCFWP